MSKKKISQQKRDKLDRDKRLLMGTGIIFFMSLIGILWVSNIQTAFDKKGLQKNQEQEKTAEFKEELSDTIDNIKQEVKSFKTVASSTITTETANPEKTFNNSSQIDKQKRKKLNSFIKSLQQELEKDFK